MSNKRFILPLTNQDSHAGDLLNVPEVAKFLRASQGTIRRFVKTRGLPTVRIGGRLFFRAADVERWVEGQQDAAA